MLSACRSRLASLGSAPSRAWSALALQAAIAGVAGAGGLVLSGCTPKIGAACELSTDCSSQGDRVCDTSEPNGYCTVENCKANECPDEAACVDFKPAVTGCSYSDRTPSRIAVAFCMIQCHTDSDCRDDTDELGRRLYVCSDPRVGPWNALILDDDQTQKTCLPAPDPGVTIGGDADASTFDAAVCQVVSPEILDEIDAGSPSDAGHD